MLTMSTRYAIADQLDDHDPLVLDPATIDDLLDDLGHAPEPSDAEIAAAIRAMRAAEAIEAEIVAEAIHDEFHALAGITAEFDPEELQWGYTVSTRPAGSVGR